MASTFVDVEPSVLKWARVSAGASLEQAAKWASVPVDRYEAWEGDAPNNDVKKPTLPKLIKLAEMFQRPIAMMFLAEPPKEHKPIRDFRKPQAVAMPHTREFRIQLRHALERRNVALELLQELEEAAEIFPLSTSISDDPEVVAARIREVMKISVADQRGWKYGNEGDFAFKCWREAIEALGVLVFQFSGVSREEMQGLAIPEFPLPIIAVNGGDATNAKTFSLFHELTHLILREEGLCDFSDSNAIEIFCNRVAGEFLVPKGALLAERIVKEHVGKVWADDELDALAKLYRVSEETILRRLLTFNLTTNDFYSQWRAIRARRRPSRKSFPVDPDVKAVNRHGRKYANIVMRGYNEGVVTVNDAASFLTVRSRYLPDVRERLNKPIA